MSLSYINYKYPYSYKYGKGIARDFVTLRFMNDIYIAGRELGMNPRILADYLGLNRIVLKWIREGWYPLSLGRLIKFAGILHCDISTSINYLYWHNDLNLAYYRDLVHESGLSLDDIAKLTGCDLDEIVRPSLWVYEEVDLEFLNRLELVIKRHNEGKDYRLYWEREKIKQKPGKSKKVGAES